MRNFVIRLLLAFDLVNLRVDIFGPFLSDGFAFGVNHFHRTGNQTVHDGVADYGIGENVVPILRRTIRSNDF